MAADCDELIQFKLQFWIVRVAFDFRFERLRQMLTSKHRDKPRHHTEMIQEREQMIFMADTLVVAAATACRNMSVVDFIADINDKRIGLSSLLLMASDRIDCKTSKRPARLFVCK